MSSFKSFLADKWLIVLILVVYHFFQFPFIHLDLWNDEIYTLKYFTFVSPLQTTFDYHSTNNHIFFNLINNFYLRIIGEKSVHSVMDHTWLLRIVSLLYSLGTIFFTFKCCEKALGKKAAVLSIIFLCTTVPFLNFAVQIRGYSLSMFLLTAITYCIFSYQEGRKSFLLFEITLLSALAAYTIPLNFYALSGIFAFLFIEIITTDHVHRLYYKRTAFALVSGIILGLVLYSPIIRKVFFNEVVARDKDFTFHKWMEMTENVFIYFFSYRYWLLAFVLIGFAVGIYRLIFKKIKEETSFLLYLVVVLTIPFIMSLIRRDALIDRTFVNLIPFFAMLMAWTIYNLQFHKLVVVAVAIYCFANLSFQLKKVSTHLLQDIQTSLRSHNIYYNYYLCHYRPLTVVKNFKEKYFDEASFVSIHDAEPYDLPEYLSKFNISANDFSYVDSALNEGRKLFLFTRHPGEIQSENFRKGHCCEGKLISEGVSCHNVFEVTPNSEAKEGYQQH